MVPLMCTNGPSTVQRFGSDVFGYVPTRTIRRTPKKCAVCRPLRLPSVTFPQAFYRDAVAWKHLKHRNIVPLLGITSTPLKLVSEWMPGGVLTEYVRGNSAANRRGLVGDPPVSADPVLTPTTSYAMSLKASSFSTPKT